MQPLKLLILFIVLVSSSAATSAQGSVEAAIDAALTNPFRKDNDAQRDSMRHPGEFFRFLGLEPSMTIAEINPGGGWYSRILAPFLKADGQYVGLEHHPDQFVSYNTNYAATLRVYPEKVDHERNMYGPRAIATWIPASTGLPVPAETVDAVIAVRVMHSWQRMNFFEKAADQVWQILKPGGVLGIVQHRADEDMVGDAAVTAERGRWKQAELIEAVEAYGFRLVASSEMNANAKDTKDYVNGVWTLPPTLALGDEDRAKYVAVGESDRMTLKFEKVAR